jgi:predicted GIY-YIG superfamily endonuclease
MIDLYRHFDKDGILLYVGISLSAIHRLSQHRTSSSWVASIESVRIEKFETRKDAVDAEKSAIISEHPKHNKTHNITKSNADIVRCVKQHTNKTQIPTIYSNIKKQDLLALFNGSSSYAAKKLGYDGTRADNNIIRLPEILSIRQAEKIILRMKANRIKIPKHW